MTECEHCGRRYEPRRAGHVFCSGRCRRAADAVATLGDPDQIARLFDTKRNPDEAVRLDDWHPTPGMAGLDSADTVAQRRRWYRELAESPSDRAWT